MLDVRLLDLADDHSENYLRIPCFFQKFFLSLRLISKILSLELKINRDLFGSLLAYSYFCSVKCMFDYPGKFPERASRIRHYPFKDHHGGLLFFSKAIHHHL